jgi:spore maturation protein CgeB
MSASIFSVEKNYSHNLELDELMRIFLTLYPFSNKYVPDSLTWYRNFYEPLIDLGHDVFLLRIDEVARSLRLSIGSKRLKERFTDILFDTFTKEHKKKSFDFFLSYLCDDDIYAECIDNIRALGVLTANFSCNNTHQFHLVEKISSHYDINLHSEKSAAEKFLGIGARPVWFQMAANPNYYRSLDLPKIYDVSFVGANYAKRADYIYHLLENGTNVHCFGPSWLINRPYPVFRRIYKEIKRLSLTIESLFHFSAQTRFKYSSKVRDMDFQSYLRKKYAAQLHHPATDEAMIRIFNQSWINLGFLEVYAKNDESNTTTQQHLHLREFEVPMSGNLYCTNYSDELSEFYEPDKEVIVYRSKYELLDKVRYYLTHQDEANMIRQAGYRRAIECHTYQKRFRELFSMLNLG